MKDVIVTETISEINMKLKMTKKCKVGDIIKLPTNKKMLWIVVKTEMTGGSESRGDLYPDAWHVTVQPLKDDGEIVGRKKTFTQETNCYNTCIPEVELVGKGKIVSYAFLK